ncbi:hypothetical protein ACTUVK_000523 [Stenotrophomonas rhizophila]
MLDKDAIDVAKHLTAALLAGGQYTLHRDVKKDADFASELFFHVYHRLKEVAVP